MKKNTLRRNRGVSMIYTVVIMTAMCMMLSLAVDYGRAQLTKTELRRSADAAARAAANFIYSDLNAATAAAVSVAAENTADGTAVTLVPAQDIQYGKWDVNTKSFMPTTSASLRNAVKVTARRTTARGTAVPMLFARLKAFNFCDVQAETIVMVIAPLNVDQNVPATANPFLAGATAGTTASTTNPHRSPDYAGTASNPLQSPLAVNMPVNEGEFLNFDSIDGTARHDPNMAYFSPDGELTDIGHNNLTTSDSNSTTQSFFNENGIADMRAPINALVGIFLDDRTPGSTSAPANLDFSTDASRNFNTLKPKLKQIFFIGDGLNNAGGKQKFVVPTGATRLYLATWDFYEWNNNAGNRNIKITRPQQIILVK